MHSHTNMYVYVVKNSCNVGIGLMGRNNCLRVNRCQNLLDLASQHFRTPVLETIILTSSKRLGA